MKISFSGAEDENLNACPIDVPDDVVASNSIKTLHDAISYVYRAVPRAHRSFFKPDGTLAGGTICLLDEQDSEMRELKEQPVGPESSIVFISTLHGG